MEFLRFGSSIPGGSWGCCAFDIIQNFNCAPDQEASIQLVDGDQGLPQLDNDGNCQYLGKTCEEIFRQRLRIGTFSRKDMPNHGFLAVITSKQLRGEIGQQWLEILKSEGFEFIRAVDNSVYSGETTIVDATDETDESKDLNYLFGLFRNIGAPRSVQNPFQPPIEWTELEDAVPEAYQYLDKEDMDGINNLQKKYHLERWNNTGPLSFFTEAEIEEAGVPVIYAGLRSKNPQEAKSIRQAKEKIRQAKEKRKNEKVPTPNPVFPVSAA